MVVVSCLEAVRSRLRAFLVYYGGVEGYVGGSVRMTMGL